MATMAMINAKCLTILAQKSTTIPKNPSTKQAPTPLLPIKNLPKGLALTLSPPQLPALTGPALAGAVFYTLAASDPALAAQQVALIAEGDNRGLALLLPIIPAIAWVLFNILQPALNQINKMRQTKGVVVGLGLTGLAASGFVPEASASEVVATVADAGSDGRGQLLLFVIAPAILWVLYNILQPALNQLNRMRSE